MSAAVALAGANGTAETAELRKPEGKRASRNCGRTAERLRKTPSASDRVAPSRLAPDPGACVPAEMPREWLPASPPIARREVDLRPHEAAVIDAALAILESRLREPSPTFERPETVKAFMRLHLAQRDRECFGVMFMDNQHRLIAFELLFAGTLACTEVHPREIVRRGLQLNAAAVVLAHNHPSGVAEPSRSDEAVTERIRWALQLVGMCLLDHIVVGGGGAVSFAERGLL